MICTTSECSLTIIHRSVSGGPETFHECSVLGKEKYWNLDCEWLKNLDYLDRKGSALGISVRVGGGKLIYVHTILQGLTFDTDVSSEDAETVARGKALLRQALHVPPFVWKTSPPSHAIHRCPVQIHHLTDNAS